jgi:hypothetical protein
MVVLAAVVFVEAASSLLPTPKPKEAVALFRSPSRSFRDAFAFLRKSMAKTVDMEEMMFLQVGRSTLLYFTSLVPISLHCAPTMDCKLAPKGSMQALARTHKLQHVRETCKCRALLHLIGFNDIETGRSRIEEIKVSKAEIFGGSCSLYIRLKATKATLQPCLLYRHGTTCMKLNVRDFKMHRAESRGDSEIYLNSPPRLG